MYMSKRRGVPLSVYAAIKGTDWKVTGINLLLSPPAVLLEQVVLDPETMEEKLVADEAIHVNPAKPPAVRDVKALLGISSQKLEM
jgi:hypothetical protein